MATDGTDNRGSATRVITVDNSPRRLTSPTALRASWPRRRPPSRLPGWMALTPSTNLAFAWRLDGGRFTAFSTVSAATLTSLDRGRPHLRGQSPGPGRQRDPTPARRGLCRRARGRDRRGGAVERTDRNADRHQPAPASTRARVTVAFNGVAAIVRSLTPSRLVTTVPPGASTGPVPVTTARGAAEPSVHRVQRPQDFRRTGQPGPGHRALRAPAPHTWSPPEFRPVALHRAGVTVDLRGSRRDQRRVLTGGCADWAGGQFTTLTVTASGSAQPGSIALTLTARPRPISAFKRAPPR